jgi:RNA polymerase sigma-70 factor (ECF subfamily)
MHTTPVSLLERLRESATEQAAWELFVKLYTPVLRAMARRLGVQGQDCDDLIQEVFTVLVKELPRFKVQPKARFRGWLWTVLKHKHLERRRRRAVNISAGDSALDEVAGPDTSLEIDETEYQSCLMQRALELMQSEFAEKTWKAFQACSEGRPAQEVADELGMKVGAVYAAKSRVLQRLRQELEGLLD